MFGTSVCSVRPYPQYPGYGVCLWLLRLLGTGFVVVVVVVVVGGGGGGVVVVFVVVDDAVVVVLTLTHRDNTTQFSFIQ